MMLKGKCVRSLVLIFFAMLLVGSVANAQTPAETQKNKDIAVKFLTMIFNEHKVEEAFKQYSVPDYKQHNPYAATGAEAAIAFLSGYVKQTPQLHTDIKRVIAEGNLVAIHNNPKSSPTDRGRAVVDIFRVENGKVVEHWDVVQDVVEKSANSNTQF